MCLLSIQPSSALEIGVRGIDLRTSVLLRAILTAPATSTWNKFGAFGACLFSRWHPPTEGRLEYMACESRSGIVPGAGGDRGDVHDRRRHAIAAGATEGAIALYMCALCLTGTRRSSPGPVPSAPARRCEKEHLAGCPCFCSTARISRARLVLAARQVPWPRRYHDVHGNLHIHVYFYMISY